MVCGHPVQWDGSDIPKDDHNGALQSVSGGIDQKQKDPAYTF